MKQKSMEYLISSSLGNQKLITDEDQAGFHLLKKEGRIIYFMYNNKTHKGEIMEQDENMKNVTLRIDDHIIELNLQDDLDQLINKMGMSAIVDEVGGDIISPMPGLVVDILAKVGDTVSKGDSMLVLEAMKMENLLQAPADGTVIEILCKTSETVDKGDLLVRIE